ncbi:GRIP and coiled-coil domain-containing protein 1 isoform X2 [Bemisia tabaci]|uniref:GRIP and coiled-coil domain-containing protein 1 isoform X2 n=1 Tax=Bemisia tabaci TaxID=7038 RepID=UPI003B2876D1
MLNQKFFQQCTAHYCFSSNIFFPQDFKFKNKKKMDVISKKDLIETVTRQEEELKRYKKRFQDVVTAHKNLIKEKEALELSLKIMTDSVGTTKPQPESSATKQEEPSEEEKGTDVPSIEAQDPEGKQSDDSNVALRTQLNKLMKSLSSLSNEKSRMEVCFQTDRKQLRQEKEKLQQEMKDMKQRFETSTKNFQSEIENLKSKLIISKHQRDKELMDHGAIVRELHQKLHDECKKREELERSVELKDQREQDLKNQIETLQQKVSKTKAPLLNRLHEEMIAMKQQHMVAIQQEQERAAKAEEQVQRLAAMHEERVANLEARLAELSLTVGSYDHLRQQDQNAISKLKERLAQLENERSECYKDKADLDFEALVSRLKHLKQLVLEASDTAEKPVDVQAILLEGLIDKKEDNRSGGDDHTICEQEYDLLKQEFENYKKQFNLQQQRTLFSHTIMNDEPGEKTALQGQIKHLKEKVNSLQNELNRAETDYKTKLEQQRKMFDAEKTGLKEKLILHENEYKSKLFALEQQVVKQRERAMAMVQEKEQEIHNLKDSMNFIIPASYSQSKKGRTTSQSSDTKSSVDEDVHESSLSGITSTNESPHMLHYAHELARRDVDISKLRQAKHKLEMTVRDLQRIVAAERDQFSQDIMKLKEEVSRLERCKSRESANLEYLKNVILSYLTSTNSSQRLHMLNAIAFVLKFSDSETKRALMHINKSTVT